MEVSVGYYGLHFSLVLGIVYGFTRVHLACGPEFTRRLFTRKPELGVVANHLTSTGMAVLLLGVGVLLANSLPTLGDGPRLVEVLSQRIGLFLFVGAGFHMVRVANLLSMVAGPGLRERLRESLEFVRYAGGTTNPLQIDRGRIPSSHTPGSRRKEV